jgi:hypothetical protein
MKKDKLSNINEEILRMKRLMKFSIYENSIDFLVEQTETKLETFDFSESYPDNIAFPVKKGSSIKSTQDVLQENNLNYTLSEFISKLKTKISKGTKIDTIKINSGASPEGANTNVPDGFDQSIVNYSFSNDSGKKTGDAFGKTIKMSVDNKTLASNRGNNMKVILTTLIPELKNANIEVKSDLSEKVVNIQIPSSVMVNFKTDPELSKEYVEPKSVYTPSFEKPSVVAGCNKDSKATGSAGASPKYIADRVKLDVPENYTGNITFKYNSYLIPDRFQLIQVTGGKSKILQDTNFVTSAKGDTFNKLQNEVKTLGGELKSDGDGTLSFKAEAGSQYFIDVIAPFGGTYWSASLGCKTDIKPVDFRSLKLDPNKEYTFYTDFVKNKYNKYNLYTENPDGNLKVYMKGKLEGYPPVIQDGSFFDINGKETKVKDGRIVKT